MILYNVTININKEISEEWLQWMKRKHIPKVMATGMFKEYKIFRMLEEEDNGGVTYAIQYFASSMKHIRQYQTHYAFALQSEHHEKYKNQYVVFRTLLQSEDL